MKKLAKITVSRLAKPEEEDPKGSKNRNQSIQAKKPWGANNSQQKATSTVKGTTKVGVETVKKAIVSTSSRQINVQLP